MNDKNLVKEILTKYPETRDNDKKLCWRFWSIRLNEKDRYPDNLCATCLSYRQFLNSTPESTITRARRTLQRFHPELRGEQYNIRKNIREPQWREDMNNDKWEEINQINANRKKQK
jgi:hypothetical protein